VMPLYRALLEADRSADARRIYERARAGYHPITQQSVDALLR
ncbi:MAG: leukotriene A4 hydrolase C-terminal domain-containing protein, partial [Nannocystaceae bacterium]|nr:leukotriene A4 hydrolase C-terminal domain-containing protein [Nannocystaceae bacterium]